MTRVSVFDLTPITRRLPVVGIVAFSACSVNSVAQLLFDQAQHDTPILWGAAALVELTTAWLVYQVVELGHQVTRSNISKQDRRFYGGMLLVFLALAGPSLGLAVWANAIEFNSVALGFVFPLLSAVCAVGAALPETTARFERAKATARQEAEAKRKERALERQRAEMEAATERKQVEAARQLAEMERQRLGNTLATLGSEAETLRHYAGNATATQSEAASATGASERTIRNHLARLERLGLIERNGQGVKVLVDMPGTNGKGG